MLNDLLCVLPLIFLLLMLILGMQGYFQEMSIWNNGISKMTDKPWTLFGKDSQGGRGYTDGEGNKIWISWPVDKSQ